MNRLSIWMRVLKWYVFSLHCCRHAHLLSASETVQKLRSSGKSFIRLGDGELNCMEGKDVHYQAADPALQCEMTTLVEEYIGCGGDCRYLLGMPNQFLNCSGWQLAKKRVFVASWSRFRYVFRKRYDLSLTYGDAFLFAAPNRPVYETLWTDKQEVIFLHNNAVYAERFRERYHKEVTFIPVGAKNCYTDIDSLEQSVREAVSRLRHPDTAVVLVSAGPCAKVLIYRLLDLPVQLIDTGHCWDDPLTLR